MRAEPMEIDRLVDPRLMDISVAVDKTPVNDQPLADQEKAGPLVAAVLKAAPEERRAVKAQAHLDALDAIGALGPFKFRDDNTGITVAVEQAPTILLDKKGAAIGIEVVCSAYDANGNLMPGDNGVHRHINPPILVPDGTAHEETIELSPGKTITMKVANYREDPVAALQEWLHDSVVATAVHYGWTV